jgi:tetratricopeptide (TPR) repeat protein
MKHFLWIIFLLFFWPVLLPSQSIHLLQGHEEYKKLNYQRAILAYEAASDKNLKAYRNLAQCYMTIGKWEHARNCLEKVCNSDQPSANDLWNYGQVLMRMEDYAEAAQVMKTFYARAPRDSRAKAYRNAGDYRKQLSRRSNLVEVKYQSFNSPAQDFGVAMYKKQLVFASTRHPFSLILREWNGNQSSFSNLYGVNPYVKNSRPKYFHRQFNGAYHDGPVAFSGDGRLCVVTRTLVREKDENGIRNLGLYISTQDRKKWGDLVPFPYNDSTYSVGQATLNRQGTEMYFVSDMPGGRGGTDIWRTECKEGKWQQPKPVYALNTEGNEMFPYLLEDLGILLFASDGHVGLGGLDMFAAKQRSERVYKIRNLGLPINSSADDFGMYLDEKMHLGYFSSNRPAPENAKKYVPQQDTLALTQDDDIYSVNFKSPFSFGKTIAGSVLDDNGMPIENAELALYLDGEVIKTATTSEYGQFDFAVDTTGSYEIRGTKEFHFDGTVSVRVVDETDEYTAELEMRRDPKISIRLLITDSEIGAPMPGVNLTVIDLLAEDSVRYRTPASGEYFLMLPEKGLRDSIAFQFILQLEGHITKTITYRSTLDHFGNYDIHKAKVNGRFLDFSMRKKTIQDDLALQLGLLPYFYEGDPQAIMPDSTGDLAILVRALLDNPGLKIEVVTHTDCRASYEANFLLSEKRAKALVSHLQARVPNGNGRIVGRGEGERVSKSGCQCEGPNGSNCTPEEYQIDRRTEFIIKGI